MKTALISIIATSLFASVTVGTLKAAPLTRSAYTVLADITTINKIEVHGNVELFISNGSADQVKVYNQYYNENALVQSKNGVLRITSYRAEKLIVWITAKDLRTISAYDNAEIKSFGSLSNLEFSLDLFNNATAKLKLDAIDARINVNDQASVELSGTVNDYLLNYSPQAQIATADLLTKATSTKLILSPIHVQSELDQLVQL